MLRRFVAITPRLGASCAAAPRVAGAARFCSNSNNKKSSEDAEELAREQKLREMFEKKPQEPPKMPSPWEGMPENASFMDKIRHVKQQADKYAEAQAGYRLGQKQQASGGSGVQDQSSSSSSSQEGQQQQQQGPPVPPPFVSATQTVWTILLYSTAVYAMAIVWQLGDDQSFVSLTQGVPHWAMSSTDLATFLLYRLVFSMREQSRIRREYDSSVAAASGATSASAPPQSFADFINQRYGSTLNGSMSTFQEAVALVAGAMRADFGRFSRIMSEAANKSSDVHAKVDAVVMALKSAGIAPIYPYSVQQQQYQQYQQQYQQYYAAQQQQQGGGYGYAGGYGQPPQQQQQQWPPAESAKAIPVVAPVSSGNATGSSSSSSTSSAPVTAASTASTTAAAAPQQSTEAPKQQQQQDDKKNPELLVGLVQQSVTAQKPSSESANGDKPKPSSA